MLEVDKILEKCGSFGRLQLIMLILTSLLNVILTMHYESEEMISFVPRHWCADGLVSGSAPPNTSSCKPLNTSHSTCHKYKYEPYMGFQSFTSETNWICNKHWKMNVGASMYTVGSLLGTLALGYMGDTVGRLPTLILANLISMIGNFLTIFGTSLFLFCLFRFINGFATDTNYAMMYILLLEYIRPSLRTICLSITVGVFYCMGAICAPWVALLLGTWRSYLLVSSVPLIIVPFFYCILLESVQWLISRQNYNKAVATLRRVAKINRVQIEDSVYEEFIASCKLSQQKAKIEPNLLDLFRTPRLRRTLFILAFDMAVISFSHFIAIRKLRRDWFPHFVWNSIQYTMVLPSWLIALAFQDIIGRKALNSISLICCSVFISITNIVLFDDASDTNRITILQLMFLLIGICFCNVAFNTASLYTVELLPTCLRCQGDATVDAFARMVQLTCTYFLNMTSFSPLLPEIILVVLTLLAACLCLLLPETTNHTLPNSLEDSEELGIDEHWYTFPCIKKGM